jgi:hypothetical protein
MNTLKLGEAIVIKQARNTDFVKEYERILRDFRRKPLTERSREELLLRWDGFILDLIGDGLIDNFVGESLMEFFRKTISVN